MRFWWLILLSGMVPAQETPTFSSSTQLVVESVVVRDKTGKVVTNLKKEDFLLREDQVPQEIRLFEFQTLAEPTPVPLDLKASALTRLPKAQIGLEGKEGPRYRDRRLLALYFDLSAMMPPDQIRALDAARKFVRTQMSSEDLVAVLVYSGGAVQVLQDFSGDRQRLLNILETLVVGEDENATVSNNDASSADTGAAFGQNDSEFNVFFSDRQLAALQTAAQMMGRIPEKKALLYFSSGLRLNGLNNQAQLNATINAAVRAGVAFWPIDARGLVASAPLGNATQGSPGGQAMYSGLAANAQQANLQRSQDTLWTLAADTGARRCWTPTIWAGAWRKRSAVTVVTIYLVTTRVMIKQMVSSGRSRSRSRTARTIRSSTGRVTTRRRCSASNRAPIKNGNWRRRCCWGTR